MKRVLIIAGIYIFFFASTSAQEINVTQEKMIYKIINDIELSADIFYTSNTQLRTNNPAIAFFHGGGWVFGSPEEFHAACERFARKGIVTFSFQYRLSIKEDGSHSDFLSLQCPLPHILILRL